MPRSSPTHAFTLTELLSALAVISILAMILIPVLQRTRESAQASLCVSNLRQLSAALLAYASDNDGSIPAVYLTYGNLAGGWYYNIWEYAGYQPEVLLNSTLAWRQFSSASSNPVEPNNIFVCPSTRSLKSKTRGFGSVVPNANLFSYGLNSIPGTVWTEPTRLADINQPARTSMVCESSYLLGDQGGYRSWFGMLPHQGSAHFAFFDGHVRRIAAADIPDTSSAAGRTFWQGR